mmetsp:Transcript_6608/g.16890  ORF Transcript_6608/g.16890 Transcript_6608/m.16890 type:complete len:211 (-) Transcript_6608:1034-1666(-)
MISSSARLIPPPPPPPPRPIPSPSSKRFIPPPPTPPPISSPNDGVSERPHLELKVFRAVDAVHQHLPQRRGGGEAAPAGCLPRGLRARRGQRQAQRRLHRHGRRALVARVRVDELHVAHHLVPRRAVRLRLARAHHVHVRVPRLAQLLTGPLPGLRQHPLLQQPPRGGEHEHGAEEAHGGGAGGGGARARAQVALVVRKAGPVLLWSEGG